MPDAIRVITKRGYTVLQNDMILDKRLSLKTKGLMAVILSRPDGWEFSVSGLAAFCNCGKDTIRGALKELETAGYLARQQLHGENGTFGGNVYVIQESSVHPQDEDVPLSDYPTTADAPLSGKPSTEKPSSGNPTQRNKDLKKEGLKEPPISPKGEKRVKRVPRWKPEAFERWWDYYRRHGRGENRAGAIKAWDKLQPDDALIRTMGLALMRQAKSDNWQRRIGIPYGSTWLNNRRWEDDVSRGAEPDEDDGPLMVEDRGLPIWT